MTGSPNFTETFAVTADNPLLRGHVVHGRNLLPGVGYVDLVLQVLSQHGHAMADVELRNLSILAPLVAAPGEHLLATVEGRPQPAGGWRVEVRSRRHQETEDVLHAVVTAHHVAPTGPHERLSLPLTGVHRLTPLSEIYRWLRGRELVHSGMMKIDGTVHHRTGDWVTELELPSAHQEGADRFLFHPALFEAGLLGGSVGSHMLHEGGEDRALYLPLVFESFRATAPLGKRCFVRVPAVSSGRDDELIRLSAEFYDESGTPIAQVGRLVAKRVRAREALDARGTTARGGSTVAPAARTTYAPAPLGSPAAPDVADVVRELVAERLKVPAAEVNVHGSFYELGLASADLVTLVLSLGDRLSLELSPTIMFEYRSIADLAAWLEGRPGIRQASAAPAATEPVPTRRPVRTHSSPPGDTVAGDPGAAVRAELVEEVSALLMVPADEVDPEEEFAHYGLDRTGLARLAAVLNDRYALALTVADLGGRRTLRAVAEHVTASTAAPAAPDGGTASAGGSPTRPHPMLHHAVPDGDGMEYRTRFDPDEPFLRDHRVRGARVLPGVVQLEMARAAIALAAETEGDVPVRLDGVVWLRPAVCGPDGLDLSVRTRPLADDSWEYTIQQVGDDGELTLCGQGRGGRWSARHRGLPAPADLRAVCADRTVTATEIYQLYADVGMEYGPAQQSVVHVGIGTDERGLPQALAELRLPAGADPLPGLRLHPGILDGALQATAALRLTAQRPGAESPRAALPFGLRHMEVSAATPTTAYAWIRHRPGRGSSTAPGPLDITVFDEHGHPCVDFAGLSTRALGDAPVTGGRTRDAEPPPARPAPLPEQPAARPPALRDKSTDIAVIGVSGRYPQADDLDEFWQNLRSGRDCIEEVPAERWDHRQYADAGGSSSGRWGGFIDGIDRFDPLFFQISLHEAELLDPQERLFLECAHHVLEDAGYAVGPDAAASRRTGVFVGVMYQEYQLHGAQAQERGQLAALSGSASSIANRVSYFYDFTGPSIAVDTMCSSSLTAIHLACEAIKSGQCDTALAGGVNIHSHANKFLMLSQRRFLSSDGRCRSFGAGGDGYVPGEGVGAVLLKPLDRAVADGDRIHGVIKGTALNHGGRTSGYSVPSPAAQAEVITEALREAGVDPNALSYLEAHGTGTALGDPIEFAGMAKALAGPDGPARCAIGSVKSNIGHCESAAGIAGVTKVLLQLRHRELVPSLHSGTLNALLDADRTSLGVQQRAEPWRRPTVGGEGEQRTLPLVAGVSGFGAGGSNAHVIIAEYEPPIPAPAPPGTAGRPALIVLSAQSEAQLVTLADRLHARLADLSDEALPGVAWTLQTGRMVLDERLAFAADSLETARALLESFVADPGSPGPWVRGTARSGRQRSAEQGAPELLAATSRWTEHGRSDALLKLWAAGTTVRWEALYPSLPPARRISLPGYPFARDRCWFDRDAVPAGEHPPVPVTATPPGGRPDGPAGEPAEVLLLRPTWVVADPGPADDRVAPDGPAHAERHAVVIGRMTAGERDVLRGALPAGTDCQFVVTGTGSLEDQYAQVVERVFTVTRDILGDGVRRPVLLQVVLAGAAGSDTERDRLACLGAVSGLLKTARQESPLLRAQYVESLDGPSAAVLAARLVSDAARDSEPEVRYRDGQRCVLRADPIDGARPAAAPWKQDGVYLITGGTGGLGLIVAHEIAASVGHATVVLTSRSALNEEQRGVLDGLRAAGLTVDHQRADVADREALARVLTHVADHHGPLNGILHSAGVIEDGYLLRKNTGELSRVLAPKVAGLVNLDELSQGQPLDLFVCFSSIAGAFGNAGQGDYAAANAFMDAYTAHRNRLVDAGHRSGRTVSVNWPLWQDGAMGDSAVRERLRSSGLAPLETADGLRALRCAMSPVDNGLVDGRLLVVVGDPDVWLPRLTGAPTTTREQRPAPAAGLEAAPAPRSGVAGERSGTVERMADRAVGFLRRLLASALKLAPERLADDVPLERYGMDSVIAVGVISQLEEPFGPLSRTLLFEVETLRDLAHYFAEDHPGALGDLLGEPSAVRPSVPDVPAPARPEPERRARAGRAEIHDRDAAPVADAVPAAPLTGRGRDIAVTGLAGRYPGADDPAELWANLRDGRDCVTEVPPGRWDHKALPGTGPAGEGPQPGKWGAFLDGIDRFDPLLFGISPREAAAMDPQQRLFMETVWHLFESSGVTQEIIEKQYRRRVGVYVGAAYQLYRAEETDPALAALTSAASYNMIANRVSHFFGLEGPSLAVDSMCASSAMAIHLACADLRRGESELAVAGGINLAVHPDKYTALAELRLLGSHPGSRSFRAGDGYLPAEAVGAVLLKPLEAALRDGDPILAVIKGTSTLHSGRSNGFMTPSRRAQVNVMRRALEQAGADARSIGYVEAAANGTAFSDEVEFRALRDVFGGVTEPVALGTVKSNLGHPEAASGIAQLTKVILQLRHRELAPLVDAGTPNPNLDFDGTALTLCDRSAPWEPRGTTGPEPAPLRALINSVAAGGSHVSLVVEAPPRTGAGQVPGAAGPQLVVLSARTPERLRTAVKRLHDFFAEDGTVSLADVAHTLQLGREAQAERLAVVTHSLEELKQVLAHHLAAKPGDGSPGPGPVPAATVHLGNAEDDAGPLGTVLAGARGEAFLAGLVADGDLDHLAQLWVRGARVPWDGLHHAGRRLAPLPLTAFEQGHYWVGRRPGAGAPPRTDDPGSGDGAVGDGRGGVAPAGELTDAEATMVAAWSDLLQVDARQLGPRSNFLSFGGNSLLAARLINLLKQRTGAELAAQAVLKAPRLADMAAELERETASGRAATLETERILAGIAVIEGMSDDELDALDLAN